MKTKKITILLLIVLVAALSACSGAAGQAATAEEFVLDGYANPAALVDTAWVEEHLDDENVEFIDVSSNAEAFEKGHLPGAQFLDWREDLTSASDPVRGQILEQDALSQVLGELGVENDETVVLYDDTNNLFATRAYWVLKYYQHDNVHVYDGGTKAWTAEGNELTTEVAEAAPVDYQAGEADPAIRTTWEYVVEHTDDPSTLFCDTRGPEEYAGTDVRSERGGHIPGAINVEWVHAVDEDGTFKEALALDELYSKAGFDRSKEVITYCQTGIRGAHTWFVLRELLGYENVRNYDGSWEEYGNNQASTIEQ